MMMLAINFLVKNAKGYILFGIFFSSYGKDQGFYEQKTYILQELWFEYGRVDAIFSLYFKYVKLIFIFFFFIQVFSWIYLVYYFFIFLFINAVNIPPFFKRFPFGGHRLMRQPYDARAVKFHFQQTLAAETE